MSAKAYLSVSGEVKAALAAGKPLVALESTIITRARGTSAPLDGVCTCVANAAVHATTRQPIDMRAPPALTPACALAIRRGPRARSGCDRQPSLQIAITALAITQRTPSTTTAAVAPTPRDAALRQACDQLREFGNVEEIVRLAAQVIREYRQR